MLSAGLTVLLMVAGHLLMPTFLHWMNVSDELYPDSYGYVMIIVYGMAAMILYNLLACIARAWETAARLCISSSYRQY
jgi:Na+-driven multidrug efflux pump